MNLKNYWLNHFNIALKMKMMNHLAFVIYYCLFIIHVIEKSKRLSHHDFIQKISLENYAISIYIPCFCKKNNYVFILRKLF